MISENKILENSKEIVKIELLNIINNEVIPAIKDIIIEAYESELEDIVNSDYDEIKPEYYKDLFIERLNNFEYIEEGFDNISVICPGMDDFDFDEELSFLYNILIGLTGNYYKVPTSLLGYDKEGVLVISEDNPALEYMDLSTLDLFEFSNNSPIDLFVDANEFLKEHLSGYIEQANNLAAGTIKAFVNGDI